MVAIVRHDDVVDRIRQPVLNTYVQALDAGQVEVAAHLQGALELLTLAAQAAARDQLRANHAMSPRAQRAAGLIPEGEPR